jgi:predicted nuclease of predicted toxin-antitoxin system
MADSIIIATARAENAVIWTQDVDFEHVPGVKFRAKKSRG